MKNIPNKTMLITYPDSLGGDLKQLRHVLDDVVPGAVGSIHILPFFPSSDDRGFAPTTYDRVDPAFGDWCDIEALAQDHPIMCDMMVNHISRRSDEFQDYMKHGKDSPYAPMFMDFDKVFEGGATPEELSMLYRRTDRPLFQEVTLPDGAVQKIWRSFSVEQMDLDTNQAVSRAYIMDNLSRLGDHGISVVRMDAYGYITKMRGTNCFFVEPQVWDLIRAMEELLGARDMTLLPEVHDRYTTALKISEQGYYTYDFVLPLLMLRTLLFGDASQMKKWFSICPRRQFTVLDTHDGVGVFDADGFVTREEAEEVIAKVEKNLSYAFKPMDMSRRKHWRSYQLYGTYYSILDHSDKALLLARAIQFFAPGIPQVYYVGMLAGRNDLSFAPDDPRAINRHNYTLEELAAETQRPVVQRILELMRLRNTHPAFDGALEIGETAPEELLLTRRVGEEMVQLRANVKTWAFTITYTKDGRTCTLEQEGNA